mgnify:CR=1 FL=1
MRYEKVEDLPESLRNDLPDEAQEIYIEAYQKSWDSFKEEMGGDLGQEAVAHRDAMHAVKQEFVEDKEEGLWYRKGEEPEEEEEDEGLLSDLADAL